MGNTDYRRLLLIVATTALGEFFLESIVYAWIIISTEENGGIRSVLLGLYVLLSTLPRIVAGMLIGVFADNAGAKRSIVSANCGRAMVGLILGVGTMAAFDSVTIAAALLLLLVTACSTLNQLFSAARAQYVQEIISPALRSSAASTSMTVLTALSIGSSAIGPFVFVHMGLVFCLTIMTVLFLFGSLLSLRIRSANLEEAIGAPVERKAGFFRSLRTGCVACWRVRTLRFVLIGAVFYGIPMGVNNVALILLWVETKGATIAQYGLASALFGLGALCGSMFAPQLIIIWSLEGTYAVSLTSLGIAYGILAFVPSLTVSFILMGVSGCAFSVFAVVQSPILLNATPSDMTGRIVATTGSASALSALLASGVSIRDFRYSRIRFFDCANHCCARWTFHYCRRGTDRYAP